MKNFSKVLGLISLVILVLSLISFFLLPGKRVVYSYYGFGFFSLIFFMFVYFDYKEIISFFKMRQTKHGSNSFIMIILMVGFISILYTYAKRHEIRFDLTENKEFSLSKESKKVLKSLKADIKITAFFATGSNENPGPSRKQFKDLIESYAHETDKITFEIIDPDKKPAITNQYGITNYGTTVLESGSQTTRVKEVTEEIFTNAIVRVTRFKKKKVYFLSGHGENSLTDTEKSGYSSVKNALETEGFEAADIILATEGKVPDDADLLVISGPKKRFFPNEEGLISDFLNRGGSAFFMIDPNTDSGMEEYLKKWGILLKDNIIIDIVSKKLGGDFSVPAITTYADHEITKDFKLLTFFPVTRSIKVLEDLPEEVSVIPLIQTGEESWGETDTQNRNVSFDEGIDEKGPLTVGVVIDKKVKGGASLIEIETDRVKKRIENKSYSMVVLGDSDFANNYNYNISGNSDIFLNIVNWLIREESFITVRPKNKDFIPVNITVIQGRLILALALLVIPLAVISIGTRKWWIRRRL